MTLSTIHQALVDQGIIDGTLAEINIVRNAGIALSSFRNQSIQFGIDYQSYFHWLLFLGCEIAAIILIFQCMKN